MDIQSLLGDEAESLLTHESKGIPKEDLIHPGPDFVDRVFVETDRQPAGAAQPAVACSTTGGWAASGYVSILPVDQGIEHSAAASFAPNPKYFDPKNIVELAIEGGCNAVASTFGVLGSMSRQVLPPHPVHREAEPQRAADAARTSSTRSCSARSSRRTTSARPAWAPPSTSAPRSRPASSRRSARRSPHAHELGMFTVLWCYLRNAEYKQGDTDYARRGRPDRRRRIISASRSRPTSSSRSCPRTTAGTRRSRATARRASSSTTR